MRSSRDRIIVPLVIPPGNVLEVCRYETRRPGVRFGAGYGLLARCTRPRRPRLVALRSHARRIGSLSCFRCCTWARTLVASWSGCSTGQRMEEIMSSATEHQEACVHAARQKARAAMVEYMHEVLILHAEHADNTDAKRRRLSDDFIAALDQQFG